MMMLSMPLVFMQKLTDKYVKNIDAAVEEKQTEIMSV